MNPVLSYCGLVCQTCPIHLATIETDPSEKDGMIREIIRLCKTHYGVEYTPEDINECDGCKSRSGRLFFGCKKCEIRKCAIEREVENCAFCDAYACSRLKDIFQKEPETKERLDSVRTGIK